MKFIMTPDCIMEGKPGNSDRCPVALHIRKHVAQDERVSVGRRGIYIGERGFEIPSGLGDWIMQFDKLRIGEARDNLPLIEFDLPLEP